MEKLHAADIPAAEVRDAKTAMRDPRVVARHDTLLLAHPKYGAVAETYGMGMPIKFSAARADFDQPPPEPGEHNQIVYGDILGYDAARISKLRAEGII